MSSQKDRFGQFFTETNSERAKIVEVRMPHKQAKLLAEYLEKKSRGNDSFIPLAAQFNGVLSTTDGEEVLLRTDRYSVSAVGHSIIETHLEVKGIIKKKLKQVTKVAKKPVTRAYFLLERRFVESGGSKDFSLWFYGSEAQEGKKAPSKK